MGTRALCALFHTTLTGKLKPSPLFPTLGLGSIPEPVTEAKRPVASDTHPAGAEAGEAVGLVSNSLQPHGL